MVIITLATVVIAAAVYFFMMPSHLSIGSISGLAIVLSGLTGFPVSAISMVLNVVLLIVGFLLIGPEFGAKTVYTSLLLPAIIGVFEVLLPNFRSLTADPFLDMICYTLVVSIGLAVLFMRNASSGGLDIIVKILNKYLRMDFGKGMAAAGMCVAVSSALLYDSKTVVISIIGTYFGGLVLDHFIFGMNPKKKVCIISEKHEQIRKYILEDLHSGATLYMAVGAYDLQEHREINVIVDKNEYSKLMTYISREDKDAFITVYSVNEVLYKPKP